MHVDITALHQQGLQGKDIAATKATPKSTTDQICNSKERGPVALMKALRCPRKSSKCQDVYLKRTEMYDQVTSSAGLAQTLGCWPLPKKKMVFWRESFSHFLPLLP
ncbi:hypothetical protein GOODEAATRI_015890 [Goodea atripinnis]|uniref:Uncharacterized protein n=1 Tax=Goodea atripinnis TaxID=208336 RepID=A0ABV0MI63_9TELE